MVASIFCWMEIAVTEPRYTTDASLIVAFVTMLLAAVSWLGFMECRTKLRKYYE
tara:strand:+ start:319 stop:480 length:162 start_codon:yes stop_codon:yes gene_type:complete